MVSLAGGWSGGSEGFLKALNKNLATVREVANEVLRGVQRSRQKSASNSYQPGDQVLLDARSMGLKVSKLAPNFLGPYEVVGVHKADITMTHVVTGDTKVVHMEHLKPFFAASPEDGYRAALVDYDQYLIDRIVAWKGDPESRSTMFFKVLFADGDEVWLPFGKDLCESIQFQEYCMSNSALLFRRLAQVVRVRESQADWDGVSWWTLLCGYEGLGVWLV